MRFTFVIHSSFIFSHCFAVALKIFSRLFLFKAIVLYTYYFFLLSISNHAMNRFAAQLIYIMQKNFRQFSFKTMFTFSSMPFNFSQFHLPNYLSDWVAFFGRYFVGMFIINYRQQCMWRTFLLYHIKFIESTINLSQRILFSI